MEKKEPPRRSESDAVAILVLPLVTHARATGVLRSAVLPPPLRALCASAPPPLIHHHHAGCIQRSESTRKRESEREREREITSPPRESEEPRGLQPCDE